MAAKSEKPSQINVWVELNPAGGVDVLGDPPILVGSVARGFTKAEADALLALRNAHGTPVCRIATGVEDRGAKR